MTSRPTSPTVEIPPPNSYQHILSSPPQGPGSPINEEAPSESSTYARRPIYIPFNSTRSIPDVNSPSVVKSPLSPNGRDGSIPTPVPEAPEVIERRQMALEDLYLGTAGVPMYRDTFQRVAKLAAKVLKMKNGVISIAREWNSTLEMIGQDGESRIFCLDLSLCNHIIHDHPYLPITIPDISKDLKYRRSPIWSELSEPPPQFYSGVPLVIPWPIAQSLLDDNEEQAPEDLNDLHMKMSESVGRGRRGSATKLEKNCVSIGTLCVMDDKPRIEFGKEEEEILLELGKMLTNEICARQSEMYAQKIGRMYSATVNFLHSTALAEVSSQKDHDKPQKTGKIVKKIPGMDTTDEDGLNMDEGKTMVIPEDQHEHDNEAQLYDNAICTICDVVDDCAVVLLDVSQYKIFLKRTAENVEGLQNKILDQKYPSMPTGYDVRPIPALTGSLKDLTEDDLFIKRIIRKEETAPEGPVRLCSRVADLACTAPFSSDEEGFSDGVAILLKRMLLQNQYWYTRGQGGGVRHPDAEILESIAPSARWVFAHPIWQTDGSPCKVLMMAWGRDINGRNDLESFVRGVIAGISAALTIRRARQVEQAQIAFSNVQTHELRTPIHQIQNIASLLHTEIDGSAAVNNVNLLSSVNDIRQASQQLESVTSNILSYFEVRKDFTKVRHEGHTPAEGEVALAQPRSLEAMMVDIFDNESRNQIAMKDDKKKQDMQLILEILPPLLGETVQEDSQGYLARAVGHLIANAIAYIEDAQGFVHVVIDDVPSLLPPEGYSDFSLTKNVSMKIQDSGIGMDEEYLQYHYFRPMKKGDGLRAGTGLSVDIARRLLGTLGGSMAVSARSGKGTTVHLEVPMTRRQMVKAISHAIKPRQPDDVTSHIQFDGPARVAYLSGFFGEGRGLGRKTAGEALTRSIKRLGCRVTRDRTEADIIFRNVVDVSEIDILQIRKNGKSDAEIAIFYGRYADRKEVLKKAKAEGCKFHSQPLSPSSLRDILFDEKKRVPERQSENAIRDPEPVTEEDAKDCLAKQHDIKAEAEEKTAQEKKVGSKSNKTTTIEVREKPAIMVVEDNAINRRILVQYLRRTHKTIIEAVDGVDAVDKFKKVERPCIILLDINMPRMDGFEAACAIRDFENKASKDPSQIIAITALSGDANKDKGLNECGMDAWLVKPTNRQQILDQVAKAVDVIDKAETERQRGKEEAE